MTCFIAINCGRQPSTDQTAEVNIATLNDEIIKFPIDVRTGLIDENSKKTIAGHLTLIKVPIDIEVNRDNRLFVLNQGTGSIPPQVTVFNDTAYGNIAPENIIAVDAGADLKPIGLAIAEGTDFIFVSYFSPGNSAAPKIIRFSISNGTRVVFDSIASSLGDIEMITSSNTILAADPLGKQILQMRVTSGFEIMPSQAIQGSNTGFISPNCLALSSDGTIHVFDKHPGTDNGRIFIFSANPTGNAAPTRVIWSYCPTGKTLIAPYGLAVTEQLTAKVLLTCSGNSLITFPADTSGCTDFLQKIDIGAPVAVSVDRVKF